MTASQQELVGRSVEFETHNSGKESTKSDKPSPPYGTNITPVTNALLPTPSTFEVEQQYDRKRKFITDPESDAEPNLEHTNIIPGNLEVRGNIKARSFIQYSDIRLKTNIMDLTDAVNMLSKLQGKYYKWKKNFDDLSESSGGRRVIGLIAQEVQRVVPEVVHEDQNGILSVSYTEIVPIVIEALKQHMKECKDEKEHVEEDINTLKHNYSSLKEQMSELESLYITPPERISNSYENNMRPLIKRILLLVTITAFIGLIGSLIIVALGSM